MGRRRFGLPASAARLLPTDWCYLDEPRARSARARDGNLGDRIGSRPPSYHAAVEAGFRAMAAMEPDRVKLIDASGPTATVTARLLYALGDLLP